MKSKAFDTVDQVRRFSCLPTAKYRDRTLDLHTVLMTLIKYERKVQSRYFASAIECSNVLRVRML